jgi:chromate reductase
LKNAVDWLSRLENQPFKDKPIAIQSATGGPLGGPRVQYQWRQVMVFLEAHVLTRPEIFVGLAQNKFDDKLEIMDQPTVEFVKLQLVAFDKYIRKLGGKT